METIFTKDVDMVERLEDELGELDFIISTGIITENRQWHLVRKYTALADGFRLAKKYN